MQMMKCTGLMLAASASDKKVRCNAGPLNVPIDAHVGFLITTITRRLLVHEWHAWLVHLKVL